MVRFTANDGTFPRQPLFQAKEILAVRFPIQRVEIDWGRLQVKRALLLDTVDQMPSYLLYPEILGLLSQADSPAMRPILDLMWFTGARLRSAGPQAHELHR